jgi:hypothetical protein
MLSHDCGLTESASRSFRHGEPRAQKGSLEAALLLLTEPAHAAAAVVLARSEMALSSSSACFSSFRVS